MDRPLPQIPPLNGMLDVTYQADAGSFAAACARHAPVEVDDDPATGSGLDARETPGHAVFDVYGVIAGGRLGQLRLGVDNLLDKTYADHLNRANQDPFNPDPVQVNEPGRTAWANWRRDF